MEKTIKLGLVTDVIPLDQIAPGWDYYEVPNGIHMVPMESEANWIRNRDMYRSRGVPTPVASHYIGGFGTMASGPSFDREQHLYWAERSFRRMSEAGVQVAGIWGGFFQAPAGYGREKAIDDAISFCNIVADQAEKYGMLVALEPNADPGTLFPSYREGLEFAKATGRRSIRVMADLNYFIKLNEPLEVIRLDPSYCLHVHMAGEGNGFSQPNIEPRTALYRELFNLLYEIGYTRTVSVAAPWMSSVGAETIDYPYETAVTLEYMRKLRDEYYRG
ncbi:sugar phosphate isomerase/epimerase family protein [Cohnella zeiphila]|uniref:Sugar phosphate isomerase/epimerase n=1 Tax=Cohnella zeiphila TaxID=2761120 RepID=A0A7X0SNW5_9BACL|nr:TIM barrel protein [Cohnella zeiphila]MBB6733467.1 sugar phosphate isomerase/epimerase [Cohnella zeiphila]